MVSSGETDFDSVFHALGWRGLYQATELTVLYYHAIPFACIFMSIIFTGFSVPAKCKEVNDTSVFTDYGIAEDMAGINISYQQCSISITGNISGDGVELSCINGYYYAQNRMSSLVSEWDLVCDKDSLSDLLQTVQVFGMAAGAFFFTILSDKQGRRFVYCLTGVITFVVSTSMTFVPTYVPFAVLKFVQGASLMGMGLTASTHIIELVPTDKRSLVTGISYLFWSCAQVVYAVAAYLMKDLTWRHHQLVCGSITCVFIFVPCLLDESSRWLATKRKYEVIERNLKKAARRNGKDERYIIELFREKVLSVCLGDPVSQTSGDSRPQDDSFNGQQLLANKPDENKQLQDEEEETAVDESTEKQMLLRNNSSLLENENNHKGQLVGKGDNAKESSYNIDVKNVHLEEGGFVTDNIDVTTKTKEKETTTIAKESEGSLADIFKDRHIFFVSAVVWFIWLCDSLSYAGLSLTSTEIHSNKYIGFGLNALVELPSDIVFMVIVNRFGRKKSAVAAHCMAGLCLVLSVICDNFRDSTPSLSTAVTVFSLLGKFAVTTAYNIIWLYTPELYPTTMRNIGYGMASLMSRIGGILAPFSRTLYRHYRWAPGSVFGSLNMIAMALVFLLPETAGQELPQTVQEMKQWLRTGKREKTQDKQLNLKT